MMRTGFLRGFAMCLVFVMLFSSACFAEDLSPKEDFLTVGNVVTFGHYEQDADESNGPEPIEWIVLDVQDGKALLLSKYVLDAKPYYTEGTDITWETCTLRTWLNNYFLNNASSQEQIDSAVAECLLTAAVLRGDSFDTTRFSDEELDEFAQIGAAEHKQ